MSKKSGLSPLRRRVAWACLECSAAALAFGLASAASAQCVNTVANGVTSTNCTGTVSSGVTADVFGQRLSVAKDASVLSGASAAVLVTNYTNGVTINGRVDGGSNPGILIRAGELRYGTGYDPYAGAAVPQGAPYYPYYGYYYSSASADLVVGQTGSISGSTGVRLSSQNGNGSAWGSITNAGSITATAGPAVIADGTNYLSRVDNGATGFIGGISGRVDYLGNSGIIDGGAAGAVSSSTSSYTGLSNDGTLRSNSTGATVRAGALSGQNKGIIANAGSGAALQTTGTLYLENQRGGVVSSGGTTAIQAAGLTLINQGTVVGSVVVTGNGSNSVDTRNGTIQGSVVLGAGDDTLLARYNAAAGRIDSVTGTVTLGGGNNLLGLTIDGDATLNRAGLPANVSTLSLSMANSAKVTLGSDFAGLNGVTVSGNGTFVNLAALTTATGGAVQTSYSNYNDRLDIDNRANITVTGGSPYLAAIGTSVGSLSNSATIQSVGVGVRVSTTSGGTFTNTGVVRGVTLGADVSYADLINSGTIIASNGMGAALFRGSDTGTGSVNSGTITGTTAGASLYSVRLANSGTIAGTNVGITADQSLIDNLAGGTITGAIAIDTRNGYAVTVRNAGTINGDIRFGGQSYSSSTNVFIDAGGTVNGNLVFGSGYDMLVTHLDAPASRPLGGVTGSITGGDGIDTVRFIVDRDATATATKVSGFERLSYEVQNGAKLTIGGGSLDQALSLVGTGTVDLSADVRTVTGPALDLTAVTIDQLVANTGGYGSVASSNAALTVINRGTLAATDLAYDPYTSSYASCAVAAGGANIENRGSITGTVSSASTWYGTPAGSAICGGGTVTNSGTIRLTGAGAVVSGAQTLINSGTISDLPGSGATGVFVTTLTNSGVIVADGAAYGGSYNGSANVTNSGRLESRTAQAVVLAGGADVLVNEKTGIIKGATAAITGAGASITNRGTIQGDVLLDAGWSTAIGNRYVADGGTIAGNLRFGAANDVFVQTGAVSGVSGVIDGGAGIDTVQLAGTGRGTFSGAINFEQLQVQSGSWTLATPANFRLGTTIAVGARLIGTTSTLLGTIDDAGTLEIAQDVDGRFQGTLRGAGTLAKSGQGTVTLAAQPGFIGTVQVLGGGLSFDGNATFALAISNGSFTGTGQIAALTLGSGGVVSPGGSGAAGALAVSPRATAPNVGTLVVTGNFVQGAGSTYLATIAADGQSDLIAVGGVAAIAPGARLQLVGTRGGLGTRYTLLTAAGGVTGRYDTIDQVAGDTEVRLAYAGTSLFGDVVRSRTGLVKVAATGNERSTAAGLASVGPANAAYAAVTTLADDGVTRIGLDTLSGQVHASLRAASVQDAQLVEAALRGHLRDPIAGQGVWGSFISGSGTNDGSDDAALAYRNTLGGVGGIERGVGAIRVSLGGGFTRTRLNTIGLSRAAQAETVHLFGIASGKLGPIDLSGGVGYGWTRNRVDRQVSVAGFRDTLRANYNGTIAHAFVEAQHAVPLAGGSVTPFLGIEAYRQHANGFGETGGAAALTGAAKTVDFVFTRVGTRLETPIAGALSVRAEGAWVRRVEGMAPEATLRFTGGSAFDVRGTPLSRDAATAELSAIWAPAKGVRVSAGYVGTVGSRADNNGFRLTAMLGF